MMADPRHVMFLAENFYNPIIFPQHVVIGNQPEAGHEAFRVGTSRRSTQNYYTAIGTNETRVEVVCDRVRAADMMILDRNCDIVGRRVRIESSNDNWLTLKAHYDIGAVDPAVVVQGSGVDALRATTTDPIRAGGAVPISTEEGAWLFPFALTAAKYWRVRIQGSVVLNPRLGGVYLGKTYRPNYPRMPFDEAARWAEFPKVRRGVPDNDIRTGKMASVSMMMRDAQEWDTARWTFRQLWGVGHPMWFIHEPNSERAWLSYNTDGAMSAPYSERPQGRTVQINMEEYDPKLP